MSAEELEQQCEMILVSVASITETNMVPEVSQLIREVYSLDNTCKLVIQEKESERTDKEIVAHANIVMSTLQFACILVFSS
jgi:hypothetical protein